MTPDVARRAVTTVLVTPAATPLRVAGLRNAGMSWPAALFGRHQRRRPRATGRRCRKQVGRGQVDRDKGEPAPPRGRSAVHSATLAALSRGSTAKPDQGQAQEDKRVCRVFPFAEFGRAQRNTGTVKVRPKVETELNLLFSSEYSGTPWLNDFIEVNRNVSIRCFRASTAEPYPSVRACDQRKRGVHAHRRRRRARPWGVVAAVGASVQFRRVHTGAREGATAHPLSYRGAPAHFTRCCHRAAQNRTRSGGLAWPT